MIVLFYELPSGNVAEGGEMLSEKFKRTKPQIVV